jgi:phosphonopyruvate decarboxylase
MINLPYNQGEIMNILDFMKCINQLDSEFFTGVPDSQLSSLCNYLMDTYGISDKHIIAANEGNCVGLAAGYHMATGKVPSVYLQNSGIGNITNPVASLLNNKVYGIPCIFIVGWRGEPGIKDEPQHVFQGEITLRLLDILDITVMILDKDTTPEQIQQNLIAFKHQLSIGKSIAFVVKKDAFDFEKKITYKNNNSIKREDIIKHIVAFAGEDVIVSTTGKASRELFEIREQSKQSHQYDFLTVGSMGHSSSIALGIAKSKPQSKIWCIDGDGAALMHMGSMALIGSNSPKNLIHIVINNSAHETVGGMPTVADHINLVQIALGCGYPKVITVSTFEELDEALLEAKSSMQLMFIEIKASLGARDDLSRPTTTANENKIAFMKHLKEVE